jgi:16S rRNA processing protein RimM
LKKEFLEAGKIVNTFGIRGELKVQTWSDRPDFLKQFKTVYISGKPVRVLSVRVHQQNALLTLEGVTDIDSALPYKNKIIEVRRSDIPQDEGTHFVADLIGLNAVNADTGAVFGKVNDILSYPAQDLYEIKGDKTYLIPDVPAFVREINEEQGFISFVVLEGMEQ